uniref:AlNc14C342G10815 protein n=1 Tax=Albugo laibachii Nc14 TaxID=890382 RepID=F0WX57_9STRA|nr:AlNc14C342G10815 [Albugo laibachii Nc14]CCA27916.1 AlNc14C827G12549 [Albugo laibachii Nc14]|eukprot:CCA27916.1 AlNc14C827G12549 [Albugo laibachii Nc14]
MKSETQHSHERKQSDFPGINPHFEVKVDAQVLFFLKKLSKDALMRILSIGTLK